MAVEGTPVIVIDDDDDKDEEKEEKVKNRLTERMNVSGGNRGHSEDK